MNKIFVRKEAVMPYEKMCKVQGDPIRHFEQLWDEIKKLKERIVILEKIVKDQRM